MRFPRFFDPTTFSIELIFTIAAVIFCFLVYYKTKESYELTRHKGLNFFRRAFLFFGLSYVMRFFLSMIFLSRIAFDIYIPRDAFFPISIMMAGYFSTIGILYLIFSTIWKSFNNTHLAILGHSVAILLSAISFLTRSPATMLAAQSMLLIAALALGFTMHKKGQKISQAKALYSMIFALWIINIWILEGRGPISTGIKTVFQIISLVVFVAIYKKVIKWV
jgi:hypothetical protein